MNRTGLVLLFSLVCCGGDDSGGGQAAATTTGAANCTEHRETILCVQQSCTADGLADGAMCAVPGVLDGIGTCFGPDCCTSSLETFDHEAPCPDITVHCYVGGIVCNADETCTMPDDGSVGGCSDDPNRCCVLS